MPAGLQKSPTLDIPRKSIELEDPGAHDLESSNDESEEFADASEGKLPTSPVPITRVEKVDTSPRHGEVPGTPAYDKRTQDAVPDEIEIVPEGSHSRSPSRDVRSPVSPGGTPVPRTRVEKVDPAEPSHGEVPGTDAHAKRLADAEPDAVVRASGSSTSDASEDAQGGPSVPRTVVTRTDSKPAHGEVPGTDGYAMRANDARPDVVEKRPEPPTPWSRPKRFSAMERSPIAADGGFGPMPSDDGDDGGANDGDGAVEQGEGDDFDDFEEGEEVDDFGDFDEGAQLSEDESQPTRQPATPVVTPEFDVLDFSKLQSLDSILAATAPHLASLYPAAASTASEPPTDPPAPPASTFLADRSASLWAQLVAPPPLQPPNWVRSRIRRLFLVSLGVPVDLDEVLPRAPQKKLILPYTTPEAAQSASEQAGPTAATSRDGTAEPQTPAAGPGRGSSSRTPRRRGPPPPPAFDAHEARALGAATTEAAIGAMDDAELKARMQALDALVAQGQEVLQYWIRRKEMAVGEKEAFDGVIENLVRHARRVRK